jgi:hypothetical protein
MKILSAGIDLHMVGFGWAIPSTGRGFFHCALSFISFSSSSLFLCRQSGYILPIGALTCIVHTCYVILPAGFLILLLCSIMLASGSLITLSTFSGILSTGSLFLANFVLLFCPLSTTSLIPPTCPAILPTGSVLLPTFHFVLPNGSFILPTCTVVFSSLSSLILCIH